MAADKNRSYAAGRFLLELNGKSGGYIKSCAGGNITAEVAIHNMGPELYQKKHIATIKYNEFTVEMGASNTAEAWAWIQASLDKKSTTMDGRVIAANYDYCSMSERIFHGAVLTEFGMPEFDGSKKDAVYCTVKFAPEKIEYMPGDGKQLKGAIGPQAKKWLCSNWRFTLGDLPCDGVAKVGAWTWKQACIEDQVGAFREATKHPAKIELPDIEITCSMKHIDAWQKKFDDFVVKGNCGEDQEMEASLTMLAPDMKTEVGRVDFYNCGFISLEPEKVEANQEAVARFKAKVYTERIQFFPKVMDQM